MKRSTSSTCDQIEAIKYPVLVVPFHGVPVPVKIRELTLAQTKACGEFSLIETMADKMTGKKLRMRDIVAYAEIQHKIVRASLVSPTYDEIMERLGGTTTLDSKKKELDELKKQCEQLRNGPQRKALEEEIDSSRIWIDLILPEDFISHIVSYALQINKSEIKKLSDEILIEAAIIAERSAKRPSEIICGDGFWTAFMLTDIDKRAFLLLEDEKERRKKMKPEKMKIGS